MSRLLGGYKQAAHSNQDLSVHFKIAYSLITYMVKQRPVEY